MDGEYSKVNFPDLKNWKRFYKNDRHGYFEMTSDAMKLHLKKNKTVDEYNYCHQQLFLDKFIRTGSSENIFINTLDLCNFLKETNIKFSEKEIINFLIDSKFIYNGKGALSGNDEEHMFLGRIYTKDRERTLHVYLSYLKTDATDCLSRALLIFSDGNTGGIFVINDSEIQSVNSGKNKQPTAPDVKLIINLFFYMSAFPENVLNKPPDVVCDKLNINNSKTISMSKEIAEYLHENRDVSPHLRRGHFRYLGSDHYTKKRGQTIFVKSSFVKGHAVTVVENEKSVSTMIS